MHSHTLVIRPGCKMVSHKLLHTYRCPWTWIFVCQTSSESLRLSVFMPVHLCHVHMHVIHSNTHLISDISLFVPCRLMLVPANMSTDLECAEWIYEKVRASCNKPTNWRVFSEVHGKRLNSICWLWDAERENEPNKLIHRHTHTHTCSEPCRCLESGTTLI